MDCYLKVYEENKKLDAMYVKLYGQSKEIFNKNILEFLVELGEFANETRCFKYWSKKKMSEKSEVLEEFADCMTMCFYFFNLLNIDLKEVKADERDIDIIDKFIYLYNHVSSIKNDFSKENLINIFVCLKSLGYYFNFSDKDIIDSCLKKIKKNIERINSQTY